MPPQVLRAGFEKVGCDRQLPLGPLLVPTTWLEVIAGTSHAWQAGFRLWHTQQERESNPTAHTALLLTPQPMYVAW